MIDFTILPLAPDTKIDKYVLATKNTVSNTISMVTLLYKFGITTFNNFFILSKNS